MSLSKEKLYQEVANPINYNKIIKTICLVYCNHDQQHIEQLHLPEYIQQEGEGGEEEVQLTYANIESNNYDEIAETIESSVLVVICVSINFVILSSGFTSIIFATRSLRKEVCYYLASGSYVDLVKSSQYCQSSVSLLIANEFINSNWKVLCEGKIKSICFGKNIVYSSY